MADAPRLVEDLAATLPLFSDCVAHGRFISPSNATLRRMGEAYLDDSASFARFSGFQKIVNAWNCHAVGGSVGLSYFLMSVILGRDDVRRFATVDDHLDWDAGLRWLVLHGINELKLWPYLRGDFVADLRRRSVRFGDGLISPVELFAIQERPMLLENTAGYTVASLRLKLAEWLLERGHQEYNLFWLLSERELLTANAKDTKPADRSTLQQYRSARSKAATNELKQSSFGPDYPCCTIDIGDASYPRQGVFSGDCRQNSRGALELLSQHTVIRCADRSPRASVVIMEMIVPELLRSNLRVKLKAGGYESERPASDYSGQPVMFTSEAGLSAQPLEISFLTDQAAHDSRSNIGLIFGLIQSLRVWRLDHLAKGDIRGRA
jgi:hypothetical protein